MNARYAFVFMGCLFLGGCATGGRHLGFEPGNSRSQCASRMARTRIPSAQLHDYMQRCTAGNDDDESSSDKSFHIGVSGDNQ